MLPEETALVGRLVREVLADEPTVRLIRKRIYDAFVHYQRLVSSWHEMRNEEGAEAAGPLPLDPLHPFVDTPELLDCESRRTRWPLEVPEGMRLAVFVALLAAWVDKTDGRSGSHLLVLFPDAGEDSFQAVMARDNFAEQALSISDARVLTMAIHLDRYIPTLFADARPKGAPHVHAIRDRWGGLPGVRDRLLDACQEGYRLAKVVEGLEKACAGRSPKVSPSDFYVAASMHTGRELCEPVDDKVWPANERRARRSAIDSTLALRSSIDDAIAAVISDASAMDSPSDGVDRRWTVQTIGHLRKLRGAILRGHHFDLFLSALPMIRAGVPEALRGHAEAVAAQMEVLKSALVAGPTWRGAGSPESNELMQRVSAMTDLMSQVIRQGGGPEIHPPFLPITKPGGWTKQELVDQAKSDDARFSASTFDRVRRAAHIEPSPRGGKGQQRRFSRSELRKLIAAVKGGTYRDKVKIVAAWEQLLPNDPPTNKK